MDSNGTSFLNKTSLQNSQSDSYLPAYFLFIIFSFGNFSSLQENLPEGSTYFANLCLYNKLAFSLISYLDEPGIKIKSQGFGSSQTKINLVISSSILIS